MKKLFSWIMSFFNRKSVVPVFDDLPPLPIAKTIESSPQKEKDDGEFYFRETILDDLDIYFRAIRRMKLKDPDAFALYSKVGAFLIPRVTEWNLELSPWFLKTLPSFGCTAHGCRKDQHRDGEYIQPKFMYFTKYEGNATPARVQKSSRDSVAVYLVTAYFDQIEHGKHMRFYSECAISIGADGQLNILKTLHHEMRKIKSRKGDFSIPRRIWQVPDYDSAEVLAKRLTSEEAWKMIFIMATWSFEISSMQMIRVDVSKGGLHAAFSVNPKRTPYFFKDRDVQTNTRKKIFHIVKPHARNLQSGKIAYVKMHFRGLRSFAWNGYQVNISIPFRDHKSLSEVTFGALDLESKVARENSNELISMGEAASLMRKTLDDSYRKLH